MNIDGTNILKNYSKNKKGDNKKIWQHKELDKSRTSFKFEYLYYKAMQSKHLVYYKY